MILLFGNSFGAHATAYALTGGLFNLATLLIGQQISGRCSAQPRARLCSGDGDGDHHGILDPYLFHSPAPLGKVAEMTLSTAPAPACGQVTSGHSSSQEEPVVGRG